MGLKLLFVCTGNTCRSPMAQGLACQLFGPEVEVDSAGLEAREGDEASPHAIAVMSEQGVDLRHHQARRIRAEQLAKADWVIAMTKAQELALQRRFPEWAAKLKCLGEWDETGGDIHDPWGGALEDYQTSAQEIKRLLEGLRRKLLC